MRDRSLRKLETLFISPPSSFPTINNGFRWSFKERKQLGDVFHIMLFLWWNHLTGLFIQTIRRGNLVKTFFCFSHMVIGYLFQQIYQVVLDLSSTKPEEIIFRKLEFSCQLFTAGSGRMWEWRNVAITRLGRWSFRFLSEKVFSWSFHIISKFELVTFGATHLYLITYIQHSAPVLRSLIVGSILVQPSYSYLISYCKG